jgi:hypothetical protein
MYNVPGVCPPEYLGKDEDNYKFIFSYLAERNVIYKVNEEIL